MGRIGVYNRLSNPDFREYLIKKWDDGFNVVVRRGGNAIQVYQCTRLQGVTTLVLHSVNLINIKQRHTVNEVEMHFKIFCAQTKIDFWERGIR